MKRALVILAVVLALVMTALWASRIPSQTDSQTIKHRVDANANSEQVKGASRPASELAGEAPEAPPPIGAQRAYTSVPAIVLAVRDSTGRPLLGAQCTWQDLPASDFSGLYVWGLPEFQPAALRAETTTTDPAGSAEFRRTSTDKESSTSLIWVTKPGFEAQWSVVPKIKTDEAAQLRITLNEAPTLRVRVEDVSKSGVNAAVVHAVGLNPNGLSSFDDLALRAFRGFHAVVETDETGVALFSALPGSFVLWAEKGTLISNPLIDVQASTGTHVLELGESVTATGVVAFEGDAVYSSSLQVTAYAWRNAKTVRCAQARVNADGVIAPFRVPLANSRDLDFVLRGGDVVPLTVTKRGIATGETVFLEFRPTLGASVRVQVGDQESQRIAGAKVLVQWDGATRGSQVAITDEHGSAIVRGVRKGLVSASASASGFVPAHVYNIEVTDAKVESVEFELARGGGLSGVVTHKGVPATEFSVVTWPPQSPRDRVESSFQGRLDGTFAIDGVPLGEVLVFAYSPTHPKSEIKSTMVESTAAAVVSLELPLAIVGRGQVVDALTGVPVQTARIQLWNSYRGGFLTPYGAPVTADTSGQFEVSGFSPGECRFVVHAEGYSQYLGQAVGIVGSVVDLGIIALHRTQRLSVALRADGTVDFTRFSSDADGNAAYPLQWFNRQGVVQWADAGPGVYFVRVYLPDESLLSSERYCRPGVDWEFSFPIDYSRSLEVVVVDPQGPRMAGREPATVLLTYTGVDGQELSHEALLGDDLKASFECVAAHSAYAEAISEAGDRLGARMVHLQDGRNRVEIAVGGKALRVRVTTRDGLPVEGATIDARMAVGEMPWFQLTSTDAAGVHTFTGLAMKRIFLNVQHNQHGSKNDVEVDLENWNSEDTLDIVLDARDTVAVRLVDGTTPVVAANLRILGPHSHHILGIFSTDANGVVRHGPVSAGSYLVSVEQPGVWLTEQLVEAGAADQPVDVQVRKLGGLALQLTSASGASTGGVAVELESIDSGATLSDWVRRGLVQVSGGALLSDASGIARVDGIPHGEYLVRVTSQAGSLVAGRVTVLPGPATSVGLTVP